MYSLYYIYLYDRSAVYQLTCLECKIKYTGQTRRPFKVRFQEHLRDFNPLTPNDHYSGRTAPLTSKRCILDIYSTNVGTEYFKHGIYSPFFFLFKMQFVS